MCTYVQRIKPDTRWKKLLTNNPGQPFICCITPTDIAYVLAIYQERQGYVGSGQESGHKSQEKGEAIIQFWRGKEVEEMIDK